MRIGELSARTGASPRSIRYYEDQGLVTSVRTGSGQRTYAESAVERVRLIRRLFDAGIGSRTMAGLLPCLTDPSIRTPWLAGRLRAERERIVAEIAELGRTVAALDAVIGGLDEPPQPIAGRAVAGLDDPFGPGEAEHPAGLGVLDAEGPVSAVAQPPQLAQHEAGLRVP